MNVTAPIPIFKELLNSSGSKPPNVLEITASLPACKGKGGPVPRRTTGSHKLISCQRNGIARLSRAIRQGEIKE
jgi:hypothetical protein